MKFFPRFDMAFHAPDLAVGAGLPGHILRAHLMAGLAELRGTGEFQDCNRYYHNKQQNSACQDEGFQFPFLAGPTRF